MSLEQFFPKVNIVESKRGVKVLVQTGQVANKWLLSDTAVLKLRCGYVGDCKDRVNGFCRFKGKWCNQQLPEDF